MLYSEYRKWSPLPSAAERGIIVGSDLSQEWILPWWWHHYQSHNTLPFTFIDFGMSEEARAWCQARGTVLRLPVADIFVTEKPEIDPSLVLEWENTYGKEFWMQRCGWFKKPLACLLSPYQTTLWIDLDCEVRSSLEELFNYAANPSGLAIAQDIHDPLAGQKGYNSGVIVFKRGLPLFEKWANLAFEANSSFAGDQDILTHLIFSERHEIAELPLLYNWSRCNGENPHAKIFHWHGRHGKTVIAKQLSKL